MPLYDYVCRECGKIHVELHKINEWKSVRKCPFCGADSKQVLSPINISSFTPQTVDATLTDKEGNDVNQFVRNKQELTDAINKYNDTERASKTGKVAVLE